MVLADGGGSAAAPPSLIWYHAPFGAALVTPELEPGASDADTSFPYGMPGVTNGPNGYVTPDGARFSLAAGFPSGLGGQTFGAGLAASVQPLYHGSWDTGSGNYQGGAYCAYWPSGVNKWIPRVTQTYPVPDPNNVEVTADIGGLGIDASLTSGDRAVGLCVNVRYDAVKYDYYGTNYGALPEGIFFELVYTGQTATSYRLVSQPVHGVDATVLAETTEYLPRVPLSGGVPQRTIMGLRLENGTTLSCLVNGTIIMTATIDPADWAPGTAPSGFVGMHVKSDSITDPCSFSGNFTHFAITKPRTLLAMFATTGYEPDPTATSVSGPITLEAYGHGFSKLTTRPDDTADLYRQHGYGTGGLLTGSPLGLINANAESQGGGGSVGSRFYMGAKMNARDGVAIMNWGQHGTNSTGVIGDVPGVVVRGNTLTRRFLYVEGRYEIDGTGNNSFRYELFVVDEDGTKDSVAVAVAPTLDDAVHSYTTIALTGGTTSDFHLGHNIIVESAGDTIRCYAPRVTYQPDPIVPKTLDRAAWVVVLEYVLTPSQSDEFNVDAACMFGVGSGQLTTEQTPVCNWAFIAATAQDWPLKTWPSNIDSLIQGTVLQPVQNDPGQEPETSYTQPADGSTTTTGYTDPTGGGVYVHTTRDPGTGSVTTTVDVKDPTGKTKTVSQPTTYDTGTTNAIRLTIRKNGATIEVWYDGKIVFTYTLTAADLSGLSLSTTYVGFYDGALNPTVPPPDAVFIMWRWAPKETMFALVLPVDRIPMGADRLWARYFIAREHTLVVRQDGTAYTTPSPTEDELDAALHYFRGGTVHPPLTADIANEIGNSGLGDLLTEIEVG